MHIRRLGRHAKKEGQAGLNHWDASSPPPAGQLHFRPELRTAGELAARPSAAPAAPDAQEPDTGTAA